MSELHEASASASILRGVGAWTLLCVFVASAACRGAWPGEDISSKQPYAEFIGARYMIIAEDVLAYGVYESLDEKTVSFISVTPVRKGGPEFAYRRPVAKGTVIRILSAWSRFPLIEGTLHYVVSIENSDLFGNLRVELPLDTRNRGKGVDLNPAVYQRLPNVQTTTEP